MARVGWRVKVAFDDGEWYPGEVTKIEDGALLKGEKKRRPLVVEGGSWWLHIKYDDGDEQITEYPNNNVRIDLPDNTVHGIKLIRLLETKGPSCMKSWFIFFLIKHRKLPDWHDCKVYLTGHRDFPVDPELAGARCPQVRNRVAPELMDTARITLEKCRRIFGHYLYKCHATEYYGKDEAATDTRSLLGERYKQSQADKRDALRDLSKNKQMQSDTSDNMKAALEAVINGGDESYSDED
jgi:hypothetical protein